MTCDLHTHSVFSDGTATPLEILDGALAAGLSAIALTDHNTVDGLPDFLAAAHGKPIDIVLGSEFSVDYNGTELHLLGLFIKPDHFDQITDMMKSMMARKEQSNIDLIDALGRAGIRLDYQEIKDATPNGKINRAHIASAMMQRGYVGSVAEAFDTYLSKTAGYYREPTRLTVWEMLDSIHSIGAVSVLAHPFLNLSERELCELLPIAKRRGLVGMECLYSLYDEHTTNASLRIAAELGLLPSGGSDYHGFRKPDIRIGVGKGNLTIPYEWYVALKEKAN